ncbi:hypothetical protein [Streptomyces sp. NPDC046805]|uniref:hypothetical protein n=1 Tax=Streptomyces sp. NPDC046805 TaxID=3155134 RepID=UPI0033D65FB1
MSTDARHAPVSPSPSPAVPPPNSRTSASAASGGDADASSPASGSRTAAGPRPADPRQPHTPAPDTGSAPPPPPASARFPDAPPTTEGAIPGEPAADATPPRPDEKRPAVDPRTALATPVEPSSSETTTRLRPVPPETTPTTTCAAVGTEAGTGPGPSAVPSKPDVPPAYAPPGALPPEVPAAAPIPDPALSWSAPTVPGGGRPLVSFAQPEGYGGAGTRPRLPNLRPRTRVAVAAACVVLGLGLIGGAVTGSWITDDSGSPDGGSGFSEAAGLWHDAPVDALFPRTVEGKGAGPGGADRTWTRIAVAHDSDCATAFDPLLRKALAPVGCRRLLRATYTDATQSYVTTVGLLFTKADSAAMSSLAARFKDQGLDRRTDLMPRPYAAKGTLAEGFGEGQRASWTVSVLTDAPVVVFAVSGWADGRDVDTPQPAADALRPGTATAPAQAGLGQEAQGLADRVERRLRKTVSPATEQPS